MELYIFYTQQNGMKRRDLLAMGAEKSVRSQQDFESRTITETMSVREDDGPHREGHLPSRSTCVISSCPHLRVRREGRSNRMPLRLKCLTVRQTKHQSLIFKPVDFLMKQNYWQKRFRNMHRSGGSRRRVIGMRCLR